jgi:hypothetical protein
LATRVVYPLHEVLLAVRTYAEERTAHIDHLPTGEERELSRGDESGAAREKHLTSLPVRFVAGGAEGAVPEAENDEGKAQRLRAAIHESRQQATHGRRPHPRQVREAVQARHSCGPIFGGPPFPLNLRLATGLIHPLQPAARALLGKNTSAHGFPRVHPHIVVQSCPSSISKVQP